MAKRYVKTLTKGQIVLCEGMPAEILSVEPKKWAGKYLIHVVGHSEPFELDPDFLVEVFDQELPLENKTPPKIEITTEQEIRALEAALNRAIRPLPSNYYTLESVKTHDVGQSHKILVVTMSVRQEH